MSTKNSPRSREVVCSRAALAASAPIGQFGPAAPPNRRVTSSEPPTAAASSSWRSTSMQLTARDARIVELVARAQALRDDQIQTALFTAGGASRCQRRLTLLVRHHYLDVLPRATVNAPFVYVLSRKSVNGNRLLRERWGEEELNRQRGRRGALGHLLAVNDARVRIERACRDLGWTLKFWQRPEKLAPRLAAVKLIPDAYFQIQREVDGQPRTAAFFLELERVGKSRAVLRAKLSRYAELYYGGRYAEIFGTRSLRLLVVFGESAAASKRRLELAVEDAARLGVTIARFVELGDLKSGSPVDALISPLWVQPGPGEKVALFDRSDERRTR